MSSSGNDTEGAWIYMVGPLGIVLMIASELSHNKTIGGVAAAMLLVAGTAGIIDMSRGSKKSPPPAAPATSPPTNPAAQPPLVPIRAEVPLRTATVRTETYRESTSPAWDSEPGITFDETGLGGKWIRHAGGPYFVTEDLDAPMPRRAVAVLDAYGQRGILHVAVDGMGSVVEAAVPGSPWGPARAR